MSKSSGFLQGLFRLGSGFLLFSKVKTLLNGALDMEANRQKVFVLYLKAVRSFRMVFLSAAAVAVAVVLLISSLVLAHVVIFAYSPWTPMTKMVVGLSAAFVYLLIAGGIFYVVFSEKRWLKIFNAHRLEGHLSQKHHDEEVAGRHAQSWAR